MAIGDQVLDLRLAAEQCPWGRDVAPWLAPLAAGDLLGFMALGRVARRGVRAALSTALREGSEQGPFLELCLVPQSAVEMALPCRIGDYTDFYTGIHHATAVGKLFRPDNPLLPNYQWVPIGYHGRASSIVRERPAGAPAARPGEGPERRAAAPRAERPAGPRAGAGLPDRRRQCAGRADRRSTQAEEHLFGIVLLNDWSARDVQAWEYQPLGPFLSKNFATTISPWVVTPEALAPFRVPFERPAGDPQPLPYLDSAANRAARRHRHHARGVRCRRRACARPGAPHERLMQSNFRDSYWTIAQLIAHHTSTAATSAPATCSARARSPAPRRGRAARCSSSPKAASGRSRWPTARRARFLEDGDSIVLRAHCERAGRAPHRLRPVRRPGACIARVGVTSLAMLEHRRRT